MKTSYDDTNTHRRNVGGKMPFKSKKQRKWMHANEPAMAKRWEQEMKKGKRAKKKMHPMPNGEMMTDAQMKKMEKKHGKAMVAGVRGKKKMRRDKRGY